MRDQKIVALMIVEVAGRPPEYLENSLKLHLEKINQIKDVRLVSSKIAEPKLIENEKDLYTCFGEVEVEVLGMSKLMDLIFDFMPSSVEIISPSEIEFDCQAATMFANDMAGRLHRYDEIAKIARMQIQQLSQQLQKYQQAFQKPVSPFQPIQISMGDSKQEPTKEKKKSSKKSKQAKKKK